MPIDVMHEWQRQQDDKKNASHKFPLIKFFGGLPFCHAKQKSYSVKIAKYLNNKSPMAPNILTRLCALQIPYHPISFLCCWTLLKLDKQKREKKHQRGVFPFLFKSVKQIWRGMYAKLHLSNELISHLSWGFKPAQKASLFAKIVH